jgi:hypothetical protein
MEEIKLQVKNEEPAGDDQRRAYVTPRLTVHGNATRLTANLDAGATDGKGGSHLDP